jgi:hypothetical protein
MGSHGDSVLESGGPLRCSRTARRLGASVFSAYTRSVRRRRYRPWSRQKHARHKPLTPCQKRPMGRIAAAGAMRLNARCGSLGDEATKPCPWATFGPRHTPWRKRTMVRVPQFAKSGACAGFRGSTLPSAPARWNQSADAGPPRNAGTKCCACAVFAEKSPAKKRRVPSALLAGRTSARKLGLPRKTGGARLTGG